MLSLRAVTASALPSAIALSESAVQSGDSELTSGSSRSLAVPWLAVALVFLHRMRRNIRSACSRRKGGKKGTFHACSKRGAGLSHASRPDPGGDGPSCGNLGVYFVSQCF
ncbi:unnamed protein product [Coccothraustes coccothraustes]